MIDKIFKAYDVRATYPAPLNEEAAWKVGHATGQYLKRSRHEFLRFFAELTVEAGMIVRVHPTLKCLRSVGSVKEVRRDAQSTHLVASAIG